MRATRPHDPDAHNRHILTPPKSAPITGGVVDAQDKLPREAQLREEVNDHCGEVIDLCVEVVDLCDDDDDDDCRSAIGRSANASK